MSISDRLKHFFHVVSNVRPIFWIGLYVAITPVFACIYWILPDGQFRIPDGASTDFGSWLYYSIVTITTLGFGDYTPAHGWAQAVTAVEVMCGLIFLGFFLNAVGSMKSEIDVTSDKERQLKLHKEEEDRKLKQSIPVIIHNINNFLSYCYAVTTPLSKRSEENESYNTEFTFNDMKDLYEPSGLPNDLTRLPAVVRFVKSMQKTSIALDSLQSHVDLTLWPELLELCFDFVAHSQMFDSEDFALVHPQSLVGRDSVKNIEDIEREISEKISDFSGDLNAVSDRLLKPIVELYYLIKENASIAITIEAKLTELASVVD